VNDELFHSLRALWGEQAAPIRAVAAGRGLDRDASLAEVGGSAVLLLELSDDAAWFIEAPVAPGGGAAAVPSLRSPRRLSVNPAADMDCAHGPKRQWQ